MGRKVHNLSYFLDESKPNWRYGIKVIYAIRKGKAFICKNTTKFNSKITSKIAMGLL
jgi:hypothetical protein